MNSMRLVDDIQIECSCCKKNWFFPEMIEVPVMCPFCGNNYNESKQIGNLKYIKITYGNEVFNSSKIFNALVKDLYCDDEVYGKRISWLHKEGFFQKYIELSKLDDEMRKRVLRAKYKQELMEVGFRDTLVNDLDEIMFSVFSVENNIGKYKDAVNKYISLAKIYKYDIEGEHKRYYEDNALELAEPTELYYRILIIPACAGNIDAQREICLKCSRCRVKWVDNELVFGWSFKLYMADVENKFWKSKYAKFIADSFAYGIGSEVDLFLAYEWYEKCYEKNTEEIEVRIELLLREKIGIGCQKQSEEYWEDEVDSIMNFCTVWSRFIGDLMEFNLAVEEQKDIGSEAVLISFLIRNAKKNGFMEKVKFWSDFVYE